MDGEQQEKSTPQHRTVNQLGRLLRALFSLACSGACLFSLAKQDARLAGKNLIMLALLLLAASVILAAIWICIQAWLFIYLLSSIAITPVAAVTYLLMFNVGLFIVITCAIIRAKNKLSFSQTRQWLVTRYQQRNKHP